MYNLSQIKVLSSCIILVILVSGCAALNPLQQVNILKEYDYNVESVNNFKIGGQAMANNGKSTSLASLPGIAFGLIKKDLSLEATVNMKISNPTGQVGNISSFKYLIEIQGKPFFEGSVNDGINLGSGENTIMPLLFKANLFGISDDNKGVEKLLSDVLTREGNGFVVLKIKPSIKIGGRDVFYPGYITIDNDLLKGLKGLIK